MLITKARHLHHLTKLSSSLKLSFSSNKIIKPQTPLPSFLNPSPPQTIQGKELITQLPQSQLFQLKQNTTPVPGNLEEREFTSLSELQKQIVESKEFDLMDKRILLQQMGISSIMEQNLTKVDLGQVSVKNKNQILLEDVDPNNIPEDMDIVFESKKKLTLVGKRVKKSGNKSGNLMKVSDSSFEEKSLAEFRGEQFRIGKTNMAFNKGELLRFCIVFLPLIFFIQPFADALNEVNIVRESIIEIENEQMESLRKIKKYYYRKMLIENPELV